MLLAVDNGSVYSGELMELLSGWGVEFRTRTPATYEPAELPRYDSFILSGRRRNDRRANALNSRLARHAVDRGLKLLGICYGAEILALAAGGTLRRMDEPRTGEEAVEITAENPLASGTIRAFESHGYEIARLPPGMATLGSSEACRHEMIRYGDLPVFGTQFHPEMSRDGREVIRRFCKL